MAKKLTAAEQEARERELARLHERNRAEGKVVIAVIENLRPDLEIAFICGEAPRWFQHIVWECKIKACTEAIRDVHYHDATFRSAVDGEEERLAFHEAYIPAFAEAFSRLLVRALAKHDKVHGMT